jgi:hypothetical protein
MTAGRLALVAGGRYRSGSRQLRHGLWAFEACMFLPLAAGDWMAAAWYLDSPGGGGGVVAPLYLNLPDGARSYKL